MIPTVDIFTDRPYANGVVAGIIGTVVVWCIMVFCAWLISIYQQKSADSQTGTNPPSDPSRRPPAPPDPSVELSPMPPTGLVRVDLTDELHLNVERARIRNGSELVSKLLKQMDERSKDGYTTLTHELKGELPFDKNKVAESLSNFRLKWTVAPFVPMLEIFWGDELYEGEVSADGDA